MKYRLLVCVATCLGIAALAQNSLAAAIHGDYLEARTCQVYTGPCFANAEVGLAGKDAIMAWSIRSGEHAGVDLSGLKVVVVVHSSDTLGFQGAEDAKQVKSVILVDQKADEAQRAALIHFAQEHAGKAAAKVARVDAAPIKFKLNAFDLRGELQVGDEAKLVTRAAREGDCICSNESAYYPPLAKLMGSAPGVAIEGEFKGRGLGSRWSIPDSRSAYMGTFAY